MEKTELNVLKGKYHDTARSYGISKELSDLIAEKIAFGKPGGIFIDSIFENKLTETYQNGNEEEIIMIPDILSYLYHEVPSRCIEADWKGFKDY